MLACPCICPSAGRHYMCMNPHLNLGIKSTWGQIPNLYIFNTLEILAPILNLFVCCWMFFCLLIWLFFVVGRVVLYRYLFSWTEYLCSVVHGINQTHDGDVTYRRCLRTNISWKSSVWKKKNAGYWVFQRRFLVEMKKAYFTNSLQISEWHFKWLTGTCITCVGYSLSKTIIRNVWFGHWLVFWKISVTMDIWSRICVFSNICRAWFIDKRKNGTSNTFMQQAGMALRFEEKKSDSVVGFWISRSF